MTSNIYWITANIKGKLAISARPRGGDWLEDEIQAWKDARIDTVVTLLTKNEMNDLELEREALICQNLGLKYVEYPILDRDVPESRAKTFKIVDYLKKDLQEGKSILVHCRQGLGRAALIAICLLIVSGIEPQLAIQMTGKARGCPVPETERQKQWVMEFATKEMMQLQI